MMLRIGRPLMLALPFVLLFSLVALHADDPGKAPAETKLQGPDRMSVIVRMQGPYDADVPLQVVCYFKRTAASDARMAGAPVELDKRLGGVIASLRSQGEFVGEELETLILDVPDGTIKAKKLLLIGLGDEASLSLEKLERVGRTALRETLRVGASRAAFAPLIRDQGNKSLAAGDVETAITRGVLLAYDTERKLQKQGFSKGSPLAEWIVEAGPMYYDETIVGVRKGIEEAALAAKARPDKAYSSKSK